MAQKAQYEIVFNLLARGGQAAIDQIQELIDLTKKAGREDLGQAYQESWGRINDILNSFINLTIDGKEAEKQLKKEFVTAKKIADDSNIFGKKQMEESITKINELNAAVKQYKKELEDLEKKKTASALYGGGKNAIKSGSGNSRKMYGTKAAAEANGQDPAKFSLEGMANAAFQDVENWGKYDFSKITDLRQALQDIQLLKQNLDFSKEQQETEKRIKGVLDSLEKEAEKNKENVATKQEEIRVTEQQIEEYNKLNQEYKENAENVDKAIQGGQQLTNITTDTGVAVAQLNEKQKEQAERVAKLREENEAASNAAENLLQRYLSLRMVFNLLKRTIQEVYQTTRQLDDAFAEIAVVSTYTTKEVWDMYDSFLKIANVTGTTSEEIIKVAGEYFKQGKSLTESLVLTEAAAAAANVAGIKATESVKYLTAALNGYKMAASDAMVVSDKFSKLAAVSATDYADLAIALGKVAAQANASGVEMDSLLGFMTMALEVTQEAPENIGTAFKTIFARMGEIKKYGVAIEDNVNANQVSKALNTIGVALFDVEGQMRDLDDVLIDVGYKWSSLDSIQQKYIATALAGTRQQTRLISIFQDFDKTMKYVNQSADSAGATLAQQAKKMDTVTFSMNRLNNAWENFVQNMGSSDTIKKIIDVVSGIINKLAPFSGILTATFISLSSVMGVGLIKQLPINLFKQGFETLKQGIINLDKLIPGVNGQLISFTKAIVDTFKGLMKMPIEKLTGWIGKLISAFKGLSTAMKVGVIGVIIAAGAALYLFATRVKRAKEEITKLYAEIYNRKENKDNVKNLIQEFEELDKKILKTAEDYEQLEGLRQQILEATDDNNIFTLSGDLDKEAYEKWNKEQIEQLIKDTKKAMEKINVFGGLGEAYYGDQADSYTKAMAIRIATIEQLTNKIGDTNAALEEYYNNMDSYSREELKNAEQLSKVRMMLEAESTRTRKGTFRKGQSTTKIEYGSIEDYEIGTKINSYSGKEETVYTAKVDIDYEIKDEGKTLSQRIAEWIGNNTNADDISKAIIRWADGLDLTDAQQEIVDKISSMNYSQMNEKFGAQVPALLQALGIKGEDWQLATEILRKNIDMTLEQAQAYASQKLQEIKEYGLTGGLAANLLQYSNIGTDQGQVTPDQALEGISKAYSLMANETANDSELIIQSLQEAGIFAEDMGKVIEEIFNSIHNLDWQSTLNQAKTAVTSIDSINEKLSSGNLSDGLNDLYSLMEQFPQYSEQIIDGIIKEGKISDKVSKQIADNATNVAVAQMDVEAAVFREKAKLWAEQAEFLATASEGEIQAAYDVANADQQYTNESLTTSFDAMDAVLAAKAQQTEEVIRYSKIQAEAVSKAMTGDTNFGNLGTFSAAVTRSYTSAIQNINTSIRDKMVQEAVNKSQYYTSQANAIAAMADALRSGKLDIFGNKGKGKGGSKAAKEYAAALDELYTITQKIAGLDAFKKLTESAQKYYDTINDGASQRAIDNQNIKLLEKEIGLYERKTEIIRKQQGLLLGELSKQAAALIKIDEETGRLILDYDNYAKASSKIQKEVDDFAKAWEDLQENWEDAQQTYWELMNEIEELQRKVTEKTIEYQNQLKAAFIKYYQDQYQKQIDALNKEKELLDKRKKMYQEAFEEQDYQDQLNELQMKRADIIAQLAVLEGATDAKSKQQRMQLLKELEQANKDYNNAVTENSRQALDKQISDQQEALEEEANRLQELMEDIPNQVEMLEAAIAELTEQGVEAVTAFLQQWSDEWKTALSTERQQIEEEWKELYDYLYGDTAVSQYQQYYDELLKKAKETYEAIGKAAAGSHGGGGGGGSGGGKGGSKPSSKPSNTPAVTTKYAIIDKNNKILYEFTKLADAQKKLSTMGSAYVGIQQLKYENGKPLPPYHYKKGGYVNFTGLAMLHGSPRAPEAVLNARQTALFERMIASLERNNTGHINPGNITIESVNVSTNNLNNAQDFYLGGQKLGEGLQSILSKRGIITGINR